MKRFLLACFLLTATCSVSFIQTATAQTTPPPTVTLADFTTKINQLDTYISTGDTASANTTWLLVHNMMRNVLSTSKYSISIATTPADKAAHLTVLQNQTLLYRTIWGLKSNLTANRVPLHTNLVSFGATIY